MLSLKPLRLANDKATTNATIGDGCHRQEGSSPFSLPSSGVTEIATNRSDDLIMGDGGQTTVTGSFSGLKPGLHGFHVHALGNTTNDPTLTVLDKNTVLQMMKNCHDCDLGNANVRDDVVDNQISLSGPNSIIGRAVVVHSDPDNLGKECSSPSGGHELSKTTGNAGGRVACGIIGIQG
ncbi:hypothetical protein CISIN_1g047402mg [Citrus sinensis]|uniref:Superoxide dismutase [Cu-Zn] n=1 Tax=Citrus sinensis TaxID=2711 RepID=A0A067DMD5_CITSI|nr:hypothetical protein CISIN_1g047402mg [Citrus sinensis]